MTDLRPDYYNSCGFEVIDFIDAFSLSFALGNVLKYITRAGKKNGEERLSALYKARYYLQHEIELEERKKINP